MKKFTLSFPTYKQNLNSIEPIICKQGGSHPTRVTVLGSVFLILLIYKSWYHYLRNLGYILRILHQSYYF